MMPPAIPPTIGPHFAAGDLSVEASAPPEEEEDDGETVMGGGEEEVWVGREEDVDTAGRERESVVVPVGVEEMYSEADAEASAGH